MGQRYSDNQHSVAIADQKTEFAKIEETLAGVRAELLRQTNECKALQNQISSLQAEKEQLESQSEKDQEKIAELERQIAGVQSQLSDKEVLISTLNAQLEQAQSKYTNLKASYDQLQNEKTVTEEQNNQLTMQVAELLVRVEELQKSMKVPIDFSPAGTTGNKLSKVLSDGNYLFTFDDVEGIWFFDIVEKKLTQKYASGLGWERFNDVPGGMFIYNKDSSNKKLLFYDTDTKEITEVLEEETGYFNHYNIIENGCFITTTLSGGTYFYDATTKKIKELSSSAYIYALKVKGGYLLNSNNLWHTVLFFDAETQEVQSIDCEPGGWSHVATTEDKCFFSGSNGSIGLWAYDQNTKEFEQIYSSGTWTLIKQLDCGILLRPDGSNMLKGILYYDFASKNCELKWSTGIYWSICESTKNGCLIINSSESAETGILYFNSEDLTITKVYDSGRLVRITVTDNGAFCFSNVGSPYLQGVIYFDEGTHECTKIIEDGNSFQFHSVPGGYLVGGSAVEGIYYFDETTKTATQLQTEHKNWYNFIDVDGGCIVSGSGTGAFLFDNEHKTMSQIFDQGGTFKYSHKIAGGYIIASSGSNVKGLYFYDASNKTMTQVYEDGYYFDVFLEVDGKLLISSSNPSILSGFLLYNIESKTTQRFGSKCFTFTPQDDVILCESADTVYVYNKKDGTVHLKYDFSIVA